MAGSIDGAPPGAAAAAAAEPTPPHPAAEATTATTTLLALPPGLLHAVLVLLPLADRLRTARVCRALRQLCRGAVQSVRLHEDDLTWGEEALAAYPGATRLLLAEVVLDSECVEALVDLAQPLLSRLRRLELLQPASLEWRAVSRLLQHCPQLTVLRAYGGSPAAGDDDDDYSCATDTAAAGQQQPSVLQELQLQRSGILPQQLHALLCAGTAHGCDQLPAWGRQLLMERSTDTAGAGFVLCSSSSAGPPLPAWPQLTRLDLSGCDHIGASLAFLGLCPALRALSLHSCYRVTNATIEGLCSALGRDGDSNHLPLQELDLSYTRIRDAAMPALVRAAPQLASLSLKGCNVGDQGVAALVTGLTGLTSLAVKHCHRVSEDAVQALSALRLHSFSYGYTSMPEADDVAATLGAAGGFSAQLSALDLLSSELTDAGLSALRSVRHLAHLRLYQAAITAEGLRELAQHSHSSCLTQLVLYGVPLKQLRPLGGFVGLRHLQLGRLCDLDGGVISALHELAVALAGSSLAVLTLERMDGLTVGVLQDILRSCRQTLEHLRVRGCDGVSADDMAAIARNAAGACGSSASIWHAATPSCDTDDDEEGWDLLSS